MPHHTVNALNDEAVIAASARARLITPGPALVTHLLALVPSWHGAEWTASACRAIAGDLGAAVECRYEHRICGCCSCSCGGGSNAAS